MSDIAINQELVGQTICNAARPEWGNGKVTRVQQAHSAADAPWRVTIHFPVVGVKTMVVPPARLAYPSDAPQREAGWLDGLGKSTLDDKLRALPEAVTDVLGTTRQRIEAVMPLYDWTEDKLDEWARRQTGVADALSHWSRDELVAAFTHFCNERDGYLLGLVGKLRQTDGPTAVREWLKGVPGRLSESVKTVLSRLV